MVSGAAQLGKEHPPLAGFFQALGDIQAVEPGGILREPLPAHLLQGQLTQGHHGVVLNFLPFPTFWGIVDLLYYRELFPMTRRYTPLSQLSPMESSWPCSTGRSVTTW